MAVPPAAIFMQASRSLGKRNQTVHRQPVSPFSTSPKDEREKEIIIYTIMGIAGHEGDEELTK